jgi:hypothetical protein
VKSPPILLFEKLNEPTLLNKPKVFVLTFCPKIFSKNVL